MLKNSHAKFSAETESKYYSIVKIHILHENFTSALTLKKKSVKLLSQSKGCKLTLLNYEITIFKKHIII